MHMATTTESTSARRAQVVRDAWRRIGGPTTNIFGWVFAFFTSYPPLAQGLYCLVIGLWPLLGLGSYLSLTGHPGEVWVVQAVGVLLVVIGATLCLAAYRRQGTPEVLFLAFGCALGLTAVDIHLVYRGLSAFYIVDAVLQVALVAFWVYGWRRVRRVEAVLATEGTSLARVAASPAPTVRIGG
jgi:hypothetical protein